MATLTEETQEDMLSHLYRVLFGNPLSMCGCGDPEAGVRLLVDLLKLHAEEGTIHRTVAAVLGDNQAVQQVVLSLLDSAGLTEHGPSLWSGWLTTKGKWVLWAARQLDAAGVDWVTDLDQAGFPHPEDCTDTCWVIPTKANRAGRR